MYDNREINLGISYDIKLSLSSYIYHMTGYITNYMIIRFHDITVAIFLTLDTLIYNRRSCFVLSQKLFINNEVS